MSNVVFTVTRSHGENHFNARVRLEAENDRLRREVALLVEEIRIKDVRMLRIAPQRSCRKHRRARRIIALVRSPPGPGNDPANRGLP